MYVKLTENDLQEILYESNIPVELDTADGITEQNFELQHKCLGDAKSKQIWFNGVLIGYGSVWLNHDIQVYVESDTPVLEMVFNLSGSRSVYLNERKQQIAFDGNQHNMIYMPSVTGSYSVTKQAEVSKAFKIVLTESYFKRLAKQDSPLLLDMCHMIDDRKMCTIGTHNLCITPQMALTMQEIMNCHRLGALKRLFLESKVIELLMLQVEQYEQATQKKSNQHIKPYDVEKIMSAKSIVEANLDNPFTLMELSRQVGLNDFKLKKGFKKLFGTTVFGYLRDLRMKKAKRLLFDTNKTIIEISEEIGYKNPHHFSTAFKKEFGLQPRELRK